MSDYDDYFTLRNIDDAFSPAYLLPSYLQNVLPAVNCAKIIDIGCGCGQLLQDLKRRGYTETFGIDISRQAIEGCLQKGLNVQLIPSLQNFCTNSDVKYNFIILNHVLEHLDKSEIISTIQLIKTHLLAQDGALVVMVPNAQSNTGCYWAYEDFTHSTLFTTGSLFYVLKAAGFSEIRFLDPEGLEGTTPIVRILKKILLSFYKLNVFFWNRVTSSYFHKPSSQIFTYELKAIAK